MTILIVISCAVVVLVCIYVTLRDLFEPNDFVVRLNKQSKKMQESMERLEKQMEENNQYLKEMLEEEK